MSAQKPASWAYAEEFVTENEVIESARRRGEELGATPVGNGAGVLLRLLAAAVKAKSVVEVGTGAGTSGLWMLQGMPEDGILTTIDVEAEHQGVAKKAYAEAGIAHQRTRVITRSGARRAAPHDRRRLRHGRHRRRQGASTPSTSSHGIRLLRSGGVLVLDNMLWHDKVADPAARDEQTSVLRDLGKALRDDERLDPGPAAGGRRRAGGRQALTDASWRVRRVRRGRGRAGTRPGPSAIATTSNGSIRVGADPMMPLPADSAAVAENSRWKSSR